MNKLLVSDIIDLNNDICVLECQSDKLKIKSNGNCTIYLINQNINNLDILVNDNSSIKVYMINKNVNNNILINIIEGNNTNVDFRYTYINYNDYMCTINNEINGDDNHSNINIRNISKNGLSKSIINVYIKNKTKNNIGLEDLKGINDGGFVHIEPNIICLSNEVEANHLTTIGSIDKDSLNYLLSKGIDEENAKELLLKGFVYSNMDDYIKSMEVI